MLTPKRKTLFFVEANIAASKTTVLRGLKKEGYTVLEEPLDIWKERYCEKDGTNILGLFYTNMGRWSFDFEVMAFVTRKKQLKEALASPSDVVVIERSLYTDRRTFALNLYRNGFITEMQWKIYDDFFWSMMEEVERYFTQANCYYLYIDTDPAVCAARKEGRGRKEEKEMVPTYLTQLHTTLRDWLLDVDTEFPVLTVNGNEDEQSVLKQTMTILGPVKKE